MPQDDETRRTDAPAPIDPTPELLDRARAEFTDDEIAAGLREIRETGGLTFEDVVRGLESPADNG